MKVFLQKNILVICIILLITGACSSNMEERAPTQVVVAVPSATPIISTNTPILEPARITKQYLSSDETIQNPERGFSSEAELTDRDFAEYYEDGVTLVYLTIQLDEYRESPIPETFMQEISDFFSAMRLSGVKAIIRFAYNDGPYPNPEPDANLEQILAHIQQLTPILQENTDMIFWLEAGFIGAWGEWHSSTNGLDEDPEAKREILFALLNSLPSNRSILLRYPVDIMTFFPEPLTEDMAVNNDILQTRIGFHNDCFLASKDDEHTYARNGVFTFDQELAYLHQSTQFMAVGGESCAYNPPRSDCPTALEEMEFFHFTELGDGWHPAVLASWEEQGCYQEINDRLGYRLSILESTVNTTVKPGGIINLQFKLKNEGFAPPVNPRPVYLVLDGPTRYELLLPIESRLWLPSADLTYDLQIRIPAQTPNGKYHLALWFPDPSDTLKNDSKYSIRLANQDLWDFNNSYNIIQNINVDTHASGAVDLNAEYFEIIK